MRGKHNRDGLLAINQLLTDFFASFSRNVKSLRMVASLSPKIQVNADGNNGPEVMRPRIDLGWEDIKNQLKNNFLLDDAKISTFETMSKADLVKGYEMMQLCRLFENACNQAYMQGHIRGFMHLDNGQESIPALVADSIRSGDKKHSYYREHTHALASGVSADKIMAELFAKDGGTCRGARSEEVV